MGILALTVLMMQMIGYSTVQMNADASINIVVDLRCIYDSSAEKNPNLNVLSVVEKFGTVVT